MYVFFLELPETNNVGITTLKIFLDFIDSFSLIIFTSEIVLKWIDNFRNYWKNPWNIFDFVVTFAVSFLCNLKKL